MLRRLTGFCCAAIVCMATVPALADAAQPKRTVLKEFDFPDDSGYDIEFEAQGNSATLSASRSANLSSSSVSYFKTAGTGAGGRRISTRLGGIAEVEVRFQERSSKVIDIPRCAQDGILRSGVFRGRFEFRGENGFASSRGRRAQGKITVTPRVCNENPFDRRSRPVALVSCQPDSDAFYFAFDGGKSAPDSHSVIVQDSLGSLLVFRSAFIAENDFESFVVGGDVSTATVSPSAPFSGSAEYAERRLTGDLAVALPGLGAPLPLTPAKAKLEQASAVSIGCRNGSAVGAGTFREMIAAASALSGA